MARILVADDEVGLREFMIDALELDDHTVTAASDGAEALLLCSQRTFDLVITDLTMPAVDGMSVLRKLRADQPETQIIVLTAHGTVDTAVEAMKLGAFDYLQKPIASPEALCAIAGRAIEHRALVDLRDRVRATTTTGPALTHGDSAMAPAVTAIERVSATNATVLLLGESGTGKEVAARAIHERSARAQGPFIALNCAAVADTLLESELFGHEKGAFTGATERRRGRIELANNGTFFLDEVGELALPLQAKLLRVLQERTFERVGGARTFDANVRWIAATNRDLPTRIANGLFREDLYHRLAVFPIRLPPLRDRSEDLLPIARALLTRIAEDQGRGAMSLSPTAEAKLLTWHWPGNVRELSNVLERATILTDASILDAETLWLDASSSPPPESHQLRTLAAIERDAIERTLHHVNGNRRRAAEVLGIGERTLYDKLKRYAQ